MKRRTLIGSLIGSVGLITGAGLWNSQKQPCEPIQEQFDFKLQPSEKWSQNITEDYIYFKINTENNQKLKINILNTEGNLVEQYETDSITKLYQFEPQTSGTLQIQNTGVKKTSPSVSIINTELDLQPNGEFSFDIDGEKEKQISFEIRNSLDSDKKLSFKIENSKGKTIQNNTINGYTTDSFIPPTDDSYTITVVNTETEPVKWSFLFSKNKKVTFFIRYII